MGKTTSVIQRVPAVSGFVVMRRPAARCSAENGDAATYQTFVGPSLLLSGDECRLLANPNRNTNPNLNSNPNPNPTADPN